MRASATGSQKYRAIIGHFGSLPYFNITETTKRRLLNYPINRSTGCGSELGTRIHKKYIEDSKEEKTSNRENRTRPYQSRRPGPVKVITETTRGTPNGHFRLHPGTGARNLLGLIRLQPNTWHPNLLGLTFHQGGTCQSRPSDTYPEPIQEDTPPFG